MNPPEHWSNILVRLGACSEAVEWARGQPDLETAWALCDRADWMLWYAMRVATIGGGKRRKRSQPGAAHAGGDTVRAACACARTALQYVSAEESRPWLAIEAAERWVEGRATIDEVRTAAAAAYAAAAHAAAAHAAADAAAHAAAAATAAAAPANAAAAAAADAAYAAAARDADADADAVQRRALATMANIVRGLIPNAPRPRKKSR